MQFSCFFLFFFLVFGGNFSSYCEKYIEKKLYSATNSCFFIIKNSPKNEFLIKIAKFHLNCLEHEGELKVFFNFHILNMAKFGYICTYG